MRQAMRRASTCTLEMWTHTGLQVGEILFALSFLSWPFGPWNPQSKPIEEAQILEFYALDPPHVPGHVQGIEMHPCDVDAYRPSGKLSFPVTGSNPVQAQIFSLRTQTQRIHASNVLCQGFQRPAACDVHVRPGSRVEGLGFRAQHGDPSR